MDAILEFLFTLVVEIANVIHFKNPKTHTWVVSAVMFLFFGILSGVPIYGAVELLRQGSAVGATVMGVIAVAFITVGLLLIARGHKNRWEKY